MTLDTVLTILCIVLLFAYLCLEKVILPKLGCKPEDLEHIKETAEELMSKYQLISHMASMFVESAEVKLKGKTGKEKREWVIAQLIKLAQRLEIKLTDEELYAFNENAYNTLDLWKSVPVDKGTKEEYITKKEMEEALTNAIDTVNIIFRDIAEESLTPEVKPEPITEEEPDEDELETLGEIDEITEIKSSPYREKLVPDMDEHLDEDKAESQTIGSGIDTSPA